MDIKLLEKALDNEENLNIINTNIQEIKNKKNDILQNLGLKKDDLKQFHNKLKNYRYIEDIKDLKYGASLRWISLNKLEKINLNNCAHLCDIKINNKGIALSMKGFNNRFFTLYLNENLLFQKLNDEEQILLKAINHLSKK
jgi:hypothetical protein